MSEQRTIEQRRAKAAWDDVSGVKDKGYSEEYKATAQNFPMLVLTNGLGQALAFLRAKGKSHHRAFYQHVSRWVTGQIYPPENDGLLEKIIADTSHNYRRSTAEALAFAAWLKRFAEAELDVRKTSQIVETVLTEDREEG